MKTHNQRMTTVYWPLQLLLLFDESGWVGGWVASILSRVDNWNLFRFPVLLNAEGTRLY